MTAGYPVEGGARIDVEARARMDAVNGGEPLTWTAQARQPDRLAPGSTMELRGLSCVLVAAIVAFEDNLL